MALSFFDTDGTLYIPGAAAKWDVAPSTSGVAGTGIVVLVGEAESGPDFTSEDVPLSNFGPNQKAAVVAKFGSGRLVDAYIQACKPSKDAGVKGAPQRIFLVKTNKGETAQVELDGGYATVVARQAGANGNLIQVDIKQGSDASVRVVKVSRKLDNVSESFTIGGKVVLTISATETVNVTVDANGIRSAGAGAVVAFDAPVAQFKTLRDVAAFISSKAGWTASVPAAFGQKSPAVLDQGSFSVVVNGGSTAPATITMDAYEFTQALNGSRLVKVSVAPTESLPDAGSVVYLTGGTKGSTSDQDVIDAFAQVERIRGNFVVPLFSQDAQDDADTDASSAYTIASINAALADHIAKMSQFKRKRPRQGFASISAAYTAQKDAARNMGMARISMTFLDVLVSGQSGLAWFQPWMGAVTAAAMQAAAFYKPIFGKQVNINGTRHYAGEFVVEDADSLEDALQAGLLITGIRDSGGFEFVSDQTTYGVDDNFVLNSIQAVYAADTVSMTVAQQMEAAFKGQNFADVSAGVAMSYFKAVMSNLRRLKLIKGTPTVPAGYQDALIEIRPPSMLVSAEVKLATGIYFIPISFLITQSEDKAGAVSSTSASRQPPAEPQT